MQYDDLQASYGRCLRKGGFINRFYDIFLESHPDIRPMFERTDWNTQRMALRRGISMAISHAEGTGLVRRGVDEMARVHARTGRCPVRPGLYPHWVESLVAAIAEYDDQATPALLQRWREAMGVVIATFVEQY